jgi:hypothetical protein
MLFRPDPTGPYDRVLQAGVDGRWEDVLSELPRLERLLAKVPSGQDGVEAARLRAGALIKLGRIDEGLGVVRALEHRPGVARPKYLAALADSYTAARDYDRAEECHVRLVEENPDTATWWVAMAEFQAIRRERADAAREALGCIDRAAAIPLLRAYIPYLEGVIALLERQDRFALQRLSEAQTALAAELPDNPTRIPMLAFCAAYRAVAQARLGDTVGANSAWPHIRRHVELHGSTLINRLCATHIPAARGLPFNHPHAPVPHS